MSGGGQLGKRGAAVTHGHAYNGRRTKEYRSWVNIKRRCLSPKCDKYAYYGGRGITVCEEWRRSFAAFLECVGPAPSPQHSIDRIDTNGNYESGNVRWATRIEQRGNRRPVAHYNWTYKLNASDAVAIKALRSQGMRMNAIAVRYGVHRKTVARVLAGQAYPPAGSTA